MKRRHVFGRVLMALGLACMLTALGLAVFYLVQEERSNQAAQNVLQQLDQQIPHATPDPSPVKTTPRLMMTDSQGIAIDWPLSGNGQPMPWPVDAQGVPQAELTDARGYQYAWEGQRNRPVLIAVADPSTPVPTATMAPEALASPTAVPTATPGPTDAPDSTATPAPTATPGPTDAPDSTATPAPTATPGPTDAPDSTTTPAPTATPGPTDAPDSTATPAPTATANPVPTATSTPAPTATATPVPTATPTPVPTATPTPVPTATPSPVPTATPTPVPTATPSPVPTATPTPVPTATPSPAPTATPTPVSTATPTPVPTAAAAPSDEPTQTPEAAQQPTASPDSAAPDVWNTDASGMLLPYVSDGEGQVIPWLTDENGQVLSLDALSLIWDDVLAQLAANWIQMLTQPDFIRDPTMPMPVTSLDGHDYIGILDIPSQQLSLPIMMDWSYPKLRITPCRWKGSLYAGDLIIAGHNNSRHFTPVKQLKIGDEVRFTDAKGNVFIFQVSAIESIDGNDVQRMLRGSETWDLTLFTCSHSSRRRYTVRCVQTGYVLPR